MHRWHYVQYAVVYQQANQPTTKEKRIKKNTRFLVNYRIYPCLLMLVLEIPPTYLPILSPSRGEAHVVVYAKKIVED